jgi:hypothetical protein
MTTCTWISSISNKLFKTYKNAIDTWYLLPGEKILLMDGGLETINEVTVKDFWNLIGRDYNWLKEPRPTKANRFWFKGMSLYYALKNFKTDYVVWIDADVFVSSEIDIKLLDIGNNLFSTMYFKSYNSEKPAYVAETGLQIFNMHHKDIEKYADEYFNYWESLEILNLYRAYDGYVTGALVPKYDFKNLVVKDDSTRKPLQNTFEFTNFSNHLVHYLGIENKRKLETLEINTI